MEFTGILKNIQNDWMTGETVISFTINEKAALCEVDKIKNKKLSVKAVQHKEKRSLTANAYYWQLLSKLAEVVGTSKPYMHNIMLRKYGQTAIIGGKTVYLVIPDAEEAEEKALEAETFHIKPTSQVKQGKDGVMYRTYKMLRGSSEYDSYEMAKLIDGLVSECKENDIETLPPHELEAMKKEWAKYEKCSSK